MAIIKCKECGSEISNKAESCPKCGAKVNRTHPVFKVIGGILLLLFAVSVFMPKDETADASAVSTENPDAPTFETTARKIAAAYSENTVAADNKFKGQRFMVSGAISDINTDFTGSPVIILVGGVNPFLEPQAELIEPEMQKAASLKKGQQITLICTGKGDIAKTPMMSDCVIE